VLAIYCRVSTSKQLEGYSIPIQTDRGTEFAKKNRLAHRVYVEQGSGADISRIEFNRMLDDIRAGLVDKIWVINRDRLQRSDLDEVVWLRNFFEEHKVQLFINDELQNLDSPEALLADNMKAVIAKYVRDNIRRHVKTARAKAKDAGRFHANTMYGYDLKLNVTTGKKEWVINEKEAIGIRYMFDRYREGVSLNSISTSLNAMGIKPKRSDLWDPVKVIKIMGNPEYFGLTENVAGHMIKSQIYPAIFPEDEFFDFKNSRVKREPAARQFRHSEKLLTGIIKCRECGSPFYLRESAKSYTHIDYKKGCKLSPKNIRIDVLEPAFLFTYLMVFLSPDELLKFMEVKHVELYAGLEDEKRLIEITESEIEGLKKQAGGVIAKMTDARFESVADQLAEALSKVSEEIKAKEKLISENPIRRGNVEADLEKMVAAFQEDALHSFEISADALRRNLLKDSLESALMTNEKKMLVRYKNQKNFVIHMPEFRGHRKDRDNEIRSLDIDMYFDKEFQLSIQFDCWNFSILSMSYPPRENASEENQTFFHEQQKSMIKQTPGFLSRHKNKLLRSLSE